MGFFLVQLLNGFQLGILLFLMAAGLTLVFGIMNVINLAHGVLFTLGAYAAATIIAVTGSFWLALLLGPVAVGIAGIALERLLLRGLARRSHLDQVLATFGIVLIAEEVIRMIWGSDDTPVPLPAILTASIHIYGGLFYPVYRLLIITAGLVIAGGLALLITRTRLGMLIRASASNPRMATAMGIDTSRLFAAVFGLGAALAGFAGVVAAPLTAVEPAMGGAILILSFVVVVIGGVGSVSGAFIAAMLVGLVDVLGRVYLTSLLRLVLASGTASQLAPALASITIYGLMALTLWISPNGLSAVIRRIA